MALTNVSSPDTHTPCYNPQVFKFTSTNYAQTNFTYVVVLTINGVTVTRNIDANPNDNAMWFDAQKSVEAYCKNEFYPTILETQFPLQGAIRKVEWSVQEKYGTPPALQGAATTGTYYVWNGAYKTLDFASYSHSSGALAKSLNATSSTQHFNQRVNYKTFHNGFGTSTDLRYILLECWDATGTNTQVAVFVNQFWNDGASAAAYVLLYIMLNASPYGFNNYTGGALSKSDPLADAVPSNTVRYTFYFLDAALNASSAVHTVYVEDFCSKYDRYVLHFLNRLGGYECFTFERLNRRFVENTQSTYRKYPLFGSTIPYSTIDSDQVAYSTVTTNKLLLNSNFLTDAEMLVLEELFDSPDIILEDSSNDFRRVRLTNRGPWEIKQKANDKIYNVTVEVEDLFKDVRQRG